MSSPTTRTLEKLRKDGWDAAVVERWNPHVRIRHDMFGFVDIVAQHPEHGVMYVQCTDGSSVSKRRDKILGIDFAKRALEARVRIEVWGWRKVKVKRGGKAKRWEVRIVVIAKEDFVSEPASAA